MFGLQWKLHQNWRLDIAMISRCLLNASLNKGFNFMFKVSHATLIFLSGLVWLCVGSVLLPLGLNFIVDTLLIENHHLPHPVLSFLIPYTGGLESAALIWIAITLMIGFLKGRAVFSKSVNRSVRYISTLPNPAPLSKIYTPGYYLLLGSMILLGVLMRFVPLDIRGGVDVAVGCALINGAMLYFRQAWLARQAV
ncbi:MAG: hypothetical protein ACH350_05575 [Parachlamydiaceae bacterium]